jgi:hypothetical protein
MVVSSARPLMVRALAAVVLAFICRDGREGFLEECVVEDVAVAVFALDDPVTGIGFALAAGGEDGGGVGTLCCVDQKRSASAKGVHSILLTAGFSVRIYVTTGVVKEA